MLNFILIYLIEISYMLLCYFYKEYKVISAINYLLLDKLKIVVIKNDNNSSSTFASLPKGIGRDHRPSQC